MNNIKNLMWTYLDGAYDKTYYKMTKFGKCLADADNPNKVFLSFGMVRQLVTLFECSENDGFEVVKKWLETRPVYENISKSTKPDVLISKFN